MTGLMTADHIHFGMQLFHGYEQQFISAVNSVSQRIAGLPQLSNHHKEIAFADLKADLSDCDKNLKFMETELSALPPQHKLDLLKKVRSYRRDYDHARKSLNKTEEDYAFEKSKEKLMGAELELEDRGLSQRQQLADGTHELKQSVRVMHETMDISTGIASELQGHSERLVQNKQKLGLIRQELTRGERSIRNMMTRIRRNKFVLFAVLAAIFLIVIIILGIHFSQ